MQLSKRLCAVASLVPQGCRLADVGTDHGYVPIWLVRQGRIPSAIAMNGRAGPLERAREHIRAAQLTGYIEARLSDGLSALAPGEADCVLLAGMGGPLMARILKEAEEKWDSIGVYVFQPQSDLGQFRRFLDAAGFRMTAEDMVEEDGKYYPMMRAVRGDAGYRNEREIDFLFGRGLLEGRHPVLRSLLERERTAYEEIVQKLRRQGGQEARTAELTAYLDRIKEAEGCYEM